GVACIHSTARRVEERRQFCLHPGGDAFGGLWVKQMRELVQMLTEVIVIPCLEPPWEVGIGCVPDPGDAIPRKLCDRSLLPASITDRVDAARDQVIRGAQHTDVAAVQHRAACGHLRAYE